MTTSIIILGGFICYMAGVFTILMLMDDDDDIECDCENPNYCDKECPPKKMYQKHHE